MTNTCTKVFLRRRPYAGGKVSLYLDYYPAIRNPHTNKMTRRETLGIVIFAEPANEMQRRFQSGNGGESRGHPLHPLSEPRKRTVWIP